MGRVISFGVALAAAVSLSACAWVKEDLSKGLTGIEADLAKGLGGGDTYGRRVRQADLAASQVTRRAADWPAPRYSPGDRIKVTATILDRDLRADALRVAASRELLQNGTWVAAPVSAATVQKLEGIILSKARDLRRNAVTS